MLHAVPLSRCSAGFLWFRLELEFVGIMIYPWPYFWQHLKRSGFAKERLRKLKKRARERETDRRTDGRTDRQRQFKHLSNPWIFTHQALELLFDAFPSY